MPIYYTKNEPRCQLWTALLKYLNTKQMECPSLPPSFVSVATLLQAYTIVKMPKGLGYRYYTRLLARQPRTMHAAHPTLNAMLVLYTRLFY